MIKNDGKQVHVAMYPGFVMENLTSFLHVSNKLAGRHGHRITFFVPLATGATAHHLTPLNRHPDLITFHPLPVAGLPAEAETDADLPSSLHHLLFPAMDETRHTLTTTIADTKPDFVFFDFATWLPAAARHVDPKITTVYFCSLTPATLGYLFSPERPIWRPTTFPPSITLSPDEACSLARAVKRDSAERIAASVNACDAVAFNAAREMEGRFCDYVERVFRRPVLLTGPVSPDPATIPDFSWGERFSRYSVGSVVFCSFGNRIALSLGQIEELVLGVERTGLPFLIALKLPPGFGERWTERGIVTGERVPPSVIFGHASWGCLVTNSNAEALLFGLRSKCRVVLVPGVDGQFIDTRILSSELGVCVEVASEDETGMFTRDGICEAVKSARSSQLVGERHAVLREFLLRDGLEDSYIDAFVQKLLTMAK